MSMLNTVRNWFQTKNIAPEIQPSPEQAKRYEEYLKADLRQQAETYARFSRNAVSNIPQDFIDLNVIRPIDRPSMKLFKADAMKEISDTIDRINSRAKTERPWKFIETGVMEGGISVKSGDIQDAIQHEKETPLFVEAVRAHNKGISAQRREKKRNVVHS